MGLLGIDGVSGLFGDLGVDGSFGVLGFLGEKGDVGLLGDLVRFWFFEGSILIFKIVCCIWID